MYYINYQGLLYSHGFPCVLLGLAWGRSQVNLRIHKEIKKSRPQRISDKGPEKITTLMEFYSYPEQRVLQWKVLDTAISLY